MGAYQEYGTPYSVEEAEELAKIPHLDLYIRDIILFLCKEIKNRDAERRFSDGVN